MERVEIAQMGGGWIPESNKAERNTMRRWLIKEWFAKRDVGLELSFKRVKLDELNEVLAKDGERTGSAPKIELPDYILSPSANPHP